MKSLGINTYMYTVMFLKLCKTGFYYVVFCYVILCYVMLYYFTLHYVVLQYILGGIRF